MKPSNSIRLKNLNAAATQQPRPTLRVLAMGLALAGCGAQALAATSYTMTDLTTVAGISPYAISSNGLIYGVSTTAVSIGLQATYLPKIYNPTDGSITDASTLADGRTFIGGDNTIGISGDINASGQILGRIYVAYPAQPSPAIRNLDGTFTDLGIVPNSFKTGLMAISDNGYVAAQNYATASAPPQAYLTKVNSGGFQLFDALNGTTGFSQVNDVNANGQIVGTSTAINNINLHAYVSTPTGLKDLHNPSWSDTTCGHGSEALAINNNGLAIGKFVYSLGIATRYAKCGTPLYHAVVWNTATGTYTDLTKPNTYGLLSDINIGGQVVGSSANPAVPGGTLAQNLSWGTVGNVTTGLTNLNTLTTGMPAGWVITNASKISDTGLILAKVNDGANGFHDVLLTPSAPSTPPPVATTPTAPSNLVSTAKTNSQVVLSWADNASNELNYLIERCKGATCTNFSQVASVGENVKTFSNTGISRNTNYTYRVRASNAVGKSAYSNTLSVKTLP